MMILFVLTMSVNVIAIGKGNPVINTDLLSYSGIVTSVGDKIFEFTVDDVVYEVHVPQYVDLSELDIAAGDSVDVTGYLRVTSCYNIIYPLTINGIVLEDLKPLDGTGVETVSTTVSTTVPRAITVFGSETGYTFHYRYRYRYI